MARSPDREFTDLLAYFRRRGRYFCTRSMDSAQAESHARTPALRADTQRDIHYYEGAGECYLEAADSLERILKRRTKEAGNATTDKNMP